MTTHWIGHDKAFTGCCGVTVFELPHDDRLTMRISFSDCGKPAMRPQDVQLGYVWLCVLAGLVLGPTVVFWPQIMHWIGGQV